MVGIENSWIAITPGIVPGTYFVPFGQADAAAWWAVDVEEDSTVWIENTAGSRRLIGAAVSPAISDDPTLFGDLLDKIDTSAVGKVFTVCVDQNSQIPALEAISSEIPLAFRSTEFFEPEDVSALAELGLIGLEGFFESAAISRLPVLPSLEYLGFGLRYSREDRGLVVPPLLNLRHLVVWEGSEVIDWEKSLRGFPKLETLVILQGQRDSGIPPFQIDSFGAVPGLKMLVLSTRNPITSLNALAACGNLEFLDVTPGALPPRLRGDDRSQLAAELGKLRKLRFLESRFLGLDEREFSVFAESGCLANLVHLGTKSPVNYESMPELSSLAVSYSLYGSESSNLGTVAFPQSLKKLVVENFREEAMRQLATSDLSTIRTLHLSSCAIDSIEQLTRFEKLRSLRIRRLSWPGAALDLRLFPTLNDFSISFADGVEEIQGLDSHPNLVTFQAAAMKNLKAISGKEGNNMLERAFLSASPKLADLGALEQTTYLESLNVIDCDAVLSIEKIVEGNHYLRHVETRGSQHLESLEDQ